jgi:hypothetical protein
LEAEEMKTEAKNKPIKNEINNNVNDRNNDSIPYGMIKSNNKTSKFSTHKLRWIELIKKSL